GPLLGPPGGAGPARVDGEEAGAAAQALEQVMEEDRVGLAGVGAPQEDDLGLLDLLVRARPAPRSEHRRQPGDARGVSRAVAAVDVVAAEDGAGELLGDVVHLVRALRAAEETERPRAVIGDDTPQAGRGAVERLVPRRGAEAGGPAALTDQWLGESMMAVRHVPHSIVERPTGGGIRRRCWAAP